MPSYETTLKELSPNDVLSVERILETYINEAFPDLDLSPGSVMRDIIVNLYAALEQRVRTEQATILRSNSLLEITADPDLADETQVNRVLSNYNITRSEGVKASGFVKFVVDSDSTTLVPVGTKLTMGNLVFKVSSNIRAISSTETVLQSGDIKLIQGTAGSFFFNVPVEAELPGSAYNIKEGTKVSGFTPKIGRTISAEAAQTMLGGKDTETNEELLTKLKQGVVGKILGGRAHIEAKLKAEFPYVISAGATGFGDPEMSRDVDLTNTFATGEVKVKSTANNTNLSDPDNHKILLNGIDGLTYTIKFNSGVSTITYPSQNVAEIGTSTGAGASKTAGSIANDLCDVINNFTTTDGLGIVATPDPPIADAAGDFPIKLTASKPGNTGNLVVLSQTAQLQATSMTGGADPQTYSRGGTVDIHARTAHFPLVETLTVTATEVATDVYEFSLTKDQCDGLYEVSEVKLPVAAGTNENIGTLCILEYDRTIELPTGSSQNSPSISTGLDLGFSSYQKVRIRVEDKTSDTSTVDYTVRLLKLPFIDVLQDYVAFGENRSVAADMVVKAAVPIFCGCNIRIVKPRTAPDIDTLEVKTAVANAVNAVKFGQPIPVSLIAHTVHKMLPSEAYVDLPINLFGNLYYPDKPKFADIDNEGKSFGDATYDNGSPDIKQLRTNDMLRAPYEPSRGVSDKTVAFFLNPYSVDVQVVEV